MTVGPDLFLEPLLRGLSDNSVSSGIESQSLDDPHRQLDRWGPNRLCFPPHADDFATDQPFY